MTPAQLVKHYDNSVLFTAYNIGYSEASVRGWIKLGVLPAKVQTLVESLTGGKLKAAKKVGKSVRERAQTERTHDGLST